MKLVLGSVVLTLTLVFAATGSAAESELVLGSKDFTMYGEGWGTAEPSRISNGGDLSGLITDVRWRSWGESVAIAYGRNSIFKPRGGYFRRPVTIKLRAEAVGQCDGRRAYTRLSFRSPKYPGGHLGRWMLWSGEKSLCDGF
jgi:hypothetical protein